jgi:hypothetical protein
MTTNQQLTPAEVRLAQYGERTSTWSTATYNDGTEKALHGIALGLKAEVDRLRTRVAELEGPAVEARAALAALCYDLEDPGSNAFGALYLISQVTVGVEAPKDDAALALGQHAREVLHEVADMADPDEPEVSFFGPTFGPQVAAWLRMLADRAARPAAVAAAGNTDGTNA